MRVVVDTSVIVDYLRLSREHSNSAFIQFSHSGKVVLSVITIAELYSGKSAQKDGIQRKFLDDLMSGAEIMAPTLETAKTVGMLRAKYQLTLGDAFIAALAIEERLPVLTFDVKAFKKVNEITLLRDN